MPGGLSTLETSVTGFPSMANSGWCCCLAVNSITGMQRGTSGTHTQACMCKSQHRVSYNFDSITSLSMHAYSLPA